MKIQEYGRSMIEMLGVLAIIGVLSVGGIAGYRKAIQTHKMNALSDQVTMAVTGIKKLYAGKYNYNGLENIATDNFNVTSFKHENGSLSHALDGDVLVRQCTRTDNDDEKALCIVLYGIDQEICTGILSRDWSGMNNIIAIGSISNGCIDEVDIKDGSHGVTVSQGSMYAYKDSIPVSLSVIGDVCNNETDNTVFFKFK